MKTILTASTLALLVGCSSAQVQTDSSAPWCDSPKIRAQIGAYLGHPVTSVSSTNGHCVVDGVEFTTNQSGLVILK